MPDEDSQDRLRIGGWVPPYRDANGPLRPPAPPNKLGSVARRALPAGFWPTSSPSHGRGSTSRRAMAALATGTLIAVTGLAALALSDGDPGATSLAQRMVVPPLDPTDPVSVQPSPTSSDPGSVIRTPAHHRAVTRPAEKAQTTRPTSRPPSTTPTVAAPRLTAGATVGLELADRPGYRLRHRNFVARLDPIGDGRDDARFTVRRGLADDGCFSLEAANFPGFFLRHRDFVLRLDRRDGSDLFDRDATFCSRPVRDGAALVLESVNYPGQFLAAGDDGVRLSRRGATAFVVRSPV
ncbi:AbfB domain-containing protein [Paractinoplanes hotanensis]|uniref:AbfB domain-containing protein n=1 Tax=Paractinoplanes hotanensis TaxID=2906497 RepID=A0ABT0XY94_9ACTN|nr:AbfB domain-containing protein [Actinoplanes hotanensis]MCM4078756.1 AbfB domain-containing protein [Actinoplanes hotanensis]